MKRQVQLKNVIVIAVTSMLAGALIVLIFVPNVVSQRFAGISATAKLTEVQDYVSRNYYQSPDYDTLADYMAYGYVAGLGDKYSTYMTAEEYEAERKADDGVDCGIGIYVCSNADNGAVRIIEVSKNSPADLAGIKAGDDITAVDGTKSTLDNYSEIIKKVSGKKLSKVKLTILRGGKEKDFEVVRDEFERQTVFYRMVGDKCLITITAFDTVSGDQFDTAIEYAQKKKAKGLIFDLRNNSGGMVASTSYMLDRLLPKGVLLYAEYRNGKVVAYDKSDKNEIDLPMCVIVNGETASAAEYFASAIRDFGKGKLIGEKTFGKGIIQSTKRLSDGSAVKLTVAEVYTKSKNKYHSVGLTPDVKVEPTAEQYNRMFLLSDKENPYIRAALKALK